jgi:murein hydrolase activator
MKQFSLVITLLLYSVISFAQTKEQLEKERKRLIQEIENTNKYLQATSKTKQATLKDLNAIISQVENRNKLIKTISSEIQASDKKISNNNASIDSLTQNLKKLNTQYAEMQRYHYLRELSNNKWTYLLSSENVNTFLLRWRYLVQFEEFSADKRNQINNLKLAINASNATILKTKQEKGELLSQEKQEATTLEKEKEHKDKMLKTIALKEGELKNELQKKRQERERLNSSIERIINEQLRLARERANAELAKKEDSNVTASSTTTPKAEKKLDDASIKLSNEFAQNKNRLPWPISSGFVSSKFGVQAHPSIKGVTIENNGIDITSKGSKEVKVIFEGTVVGVTRVPGSNNMIIVRHGNYYSVYSNLTSVQVHQGTVLSTQQTLGHIQPNDDGDAELHFELWKDKSKLNPESWLR